MSDASTFRYFRGAFIVTAAGLVLGAWLGWSMSGTLAGMLKVFIICAVLAALEISLSFDNAIVNANKLKTMDPIWQRRFLTWGIAIAVFGMRIIFPLAIVCIAAKVGPIAAFNLALSQPDTYAEIMHDAHIPIAAFGGTFLLMVSLGYFLDAEKDLHWFNKLEAMLARGGSVKGLEIAFVLVVIIIFTMLLPQGDAAIFLRSAIYGLVTFLIVDMLGHILDSSDVSDTAARGGLGAFLYLEVLDASFSFDGVIGAFAITQNLLIIAIGLSIGAMYVRSMTIMLVEKGTLTEYRFLEHGAFYAIMALAILMYIQTLTPIPEVITGLLGVSLILAAFVSSIRLRAREGAQTAPEQPVNS